MQATLHNADPLDHRQFLVAVKRLADSLSYGTDRSPFLGQGLEYVQSRRYEPGDPVKSIDWRVTARTGKHHVKQFETPKQMPVWLVVDTSASMAIASHPPGKYGLAVQVAGGIALACLDHVNPVGVLGAGGRDLVIQPSLSRDVLLQWLHALRHYRFDEPTTLGQRLLSLEPSLTQRSMLIVLSDFHDPDALAAMKLIGARHDCLCLIFRDPAEDQLEGAGLFRGREVESGRELLTHGKRLLSTTDALTESLKKASLDHFLIRPGTPFLGQLRHFLRSRGGASRRSRQ
ncbi:DUF58 domain-containing protein [Luteolibacter flavescens]|uniref:DUF58 domain-containing protein n=1 Tax=Luteolibacter flavescens TaxID=1859460 RepID=A0ABT3FN20_9BACT|nr:DUF58 domain-containing protein [Luteolibacter flavescens]MCW1884599.1 DUF58 domain-containing protein [Luteolibacter flavescens]